MLITMGNLNRLDIGRLKDSCGGWIAIGVGSVGVCVGVGVGVVGGVPQP